MVKENDAILSSGWLVTIQRSYWAYPLMIFILSRLFLVGIGLITFATFSGDYLTVRPVPENPLLDMWARWDSRWYVLIAENGYSFTPGEMSSIAFFPLYPIAIRIVDTLIQQPYLSGWLISNLCFVACLILCYRYILEKFQRQTLAQLFILYLCFVPNTFFFSAVYTESLFFLLVISCIVAVEKDHWLVAGICGALASATRVVGVVLWVYLCLEWLRIYWREPKTMRAWRNLFFIQLTPLGLLAYMSYLAMQFGNPLLFLEAQSQWGKKVTNPIHVLLTTLEGIFNETLYGYFAPLELFLGFICLMILPFIWKKLGWNQFILAALMICIPLSSSVYSFNRYALVVFPLSLTITMMTENKKVRKYFLLGSILFLMLTFYLFVIGVFVG